MNNISPLAPALRSFGLLDPHEKRTFFALVFGRVLSHVLDLFALALLALAGSLVANPRSVQAGDLIGPLVDSLGVDVLIVSLLLASSLFIVKSLISVKLLAATSKFLGLVEARQAEKVASGLFLGKSPRIDSTSRPEAQWSTGHSVHAAFPNLLHATMTIISEGSLFLFVFIAFAITDWLLAITVLTMFLLSLGVFRLIVQRKLSAVGRALAHEAKESTSFLLSLIEGNKELRVYGRLWRALGSFVYHRREHALLQSAQRFFLSAPRFFVETGLMVAVIVALTLEVLVPGGFLNVEVLGVFLAGGFRLVTAVLPVQNALTEFRMSGPQAQEAHKILWSMRDDGENQEEKPLYLAAGRKNPPTLQFENVTYRYEGALQYAIEGVSIEVPAGDSLALIGSSGAGKTTIADLLLGIVGPTAGEVLIGELPPREFIRENSNCVAYVPQKPLIIGGTILDNLRFFMDENSLDPMEAITVLSEVGLRSWVESLPDGIQTQLGPHGTRLSGGQAQRLGIARALLNRPGLLVLDESTSYLDAASEHAIAGIIESLKGRVTVVLIAHRLSLVKNMPRIAFVNKGKIVDVGSLSFLSSNHDEVRKNVELLSVRP